MNTTLKPLVIAAIVALAVTGCTSGSSDTSTSTTAAPAGPPAIDMAYEHCQVVLNAYLKAPATAAYPAIDDISVVDYDDGMYSFTGHVDSENSYGALIRTSFVCSADEVGDEGRFSASRLSLDGEVLVDRDGIFSYRPRQLTPASPPPH